MIEVPTRGFVMRATSVLSVWLLTLALATPVVEGAQDSKTPPATPDPVDQAELDARARVLKQWVDDYTRWKQSRDERERVDSRREARPRPEPPEWLFADCRDVAVDGTGLWADACRLLMDWKDDALAAQLRREITESRAQRETPTKTVWWQHVNLDTLWPMTQWGTDVYGVVGAHVTVEVAGRFQVFVAPGVMLLTAPGDRGARDWNVATDWGIAYRLLDFRFPDTRRHAQLHLNLVTAWVFSGSSSFVANRINLVGFSFTFKQPAAP